MKQFAVIALASAVAASAAYAAVNASINERREHFSAMGKAVKMPVKMFKGEEKFDLAVVQAALKTMQEKAAVLPKLFPDDSKEGEDEEGDKTEALAAIWDNKADFEGRFKKLADAAKAAEATMTDEVSFKAGFQDLMGNCGGCHKKYREDKD
jgi:cytochrome c556